MKGKRIRQVSDSSGTYKRANLGPATSGEGAETARPLSLRVWLTVWVVLVAVVVQAMFATVVFLYVRSSVENFFNQRVQARLVDCVGFIAASQTLPDAASLSLILQEGPKSVMATEFALALLTTDETVKPIVTNPGLILPDLSWSRGVLPAGSTTAVPNSAGEKNVQTSGNLPPRRLDVGVIRDGQDPEIMNARFVAQRAMLKSGEQVIAVALSLDSYGDQISRLAWRVVWTVSGLGVAATALAMWFISGLALRPLAAAGVWAGTLDPSKPATMLRSMGSMQFSELENLRGQLEAARARVTQALSLNERFLANVSHELKTPLATMMAEAQTLSLTNASPAVRAFVRSVNAELQRLGNTVDSFLLLAGVRSGGALMQESVVNIHDVVLETLANCGTMARQCQVLINPILHDGEEELLVMGSQELLRVLLNNVVRNALRFSPRAGLVYLKVVAEPTYINIKVRDSGPGVPEELMERLFERFAQGTAEVGRGRGHGLGLSIAQGIAELHGGGITVRNISADEAGPGADRPAVTDPSTLICGCEFTIRLPRITRPRG